MYSLSLPLFPACNAWQLSKLTSVSAVEISSEHQPHCSGLVMVHSDIRCIHNPSLMRKFPGQFNLSSWLRPVTERCTGFQRNPQIEVVCSRTSKITRDPPGNIHPRQPLVTSESSSRSTHLLVELRARSMFVLKLNINSETVKVPSHSSSGCITRPASCRALSSPCSLSISSTFRAGRCDTRIFPVE